MKILNYKIDSIKHSININKFDNFKNNEIININKYLNSYKYIVSISQNQIFIDLKILLNQWISFANKHNITWWMTA
jgi:hypothetical protein